MKYKIQRKHDRTKKSQLGQFLTPMEKSIEIVNKLSLNADSKIFEPGCGDGSFIIPLIDLFLGFYSGDMLDRLTSVLTRNIYAVEFDPLLYQQLLKNIELKYGCLPAKHNLYQDDFLIREIELESFDIGVGNPPFGATLNYEHQNDLEKRYGRRNGYKIKKESYSFFVVKSVDILKNNGRFVFICSDSFLTISTMKGLRRFLIDNGEVDINHLDYFSEETNYPMVVITFTKGPPSDFVMVDGVKIVRENMELTGNFSWTINGSVRYFEGRKLSDFIICSGGMTTGNNAYFVKEIKDGHISEEYEYTYFEEPISLARELQKARLNQLSETVQTRIKMQEESGKTRRNVKITNRPEPVTISLPHPDYFHYNKSSSSIVFERPAWAIFWKDDGDAVKTFKSNGNWYLHGVGGEKFFCKEGITWSLIASKMKVRYLPSGYILDNGSPCGFLRPDVPQDELFFILAWMLTDKANDLLKKYINHTKNIQGKDVERLPYPFWISPELKINIVDKIKELIERAKVEEFNFDSAEIKEFNKLFEDNFGS